MTPAPAASANRQFLLWTLALLLLAGYGLHALWTRGLPWAAGAAARLVPAAWERELGESIAASIAPGAKPCLEDAAARLARSLPSPSHPPTPLRSAVSPPPASTPWPPPAA